MTTEPGEDDLAVVRRERDQAIAHARAVEHELGALRGDVKRLERLLWRRTARRQLAVAWARRLRLALFGRREL